MRRLLLLLLLLTPASAADDYFPPPDRDGGRKQFKSTQRFENPIYRRMHGTLLEGD